MAYSYKFQFFSDYKHRDSTISSSYIEFQNSFSITPNEYNKDIRGFITISGEPHWLTVGQIDDMIAVLTAIRDRVVK